LSTERAINVSDNDQPCCIPIGKFPWMEDSKNIGWRKKTQRNSRRSVDTSLPRLSTHARSSCIPSAKRAFGLHHHHCRSEPDITPSVTLPSTFHFLISLRAHLPLFISSHPRPSIRIRLPRRGSRSRFRRHLLLSSLVRVSSEALPNRSYE
jgi:hypothetical protein